MTCKICKHRHEVYSCSPNECYATINKPNRYVNCIIVLPVKYFMQYCNWQHTHAYKTEIRFCNKATPSIKLINMIDTVTTISTWPISAIVAYLEENGLK